MPGFLFACCQQPACKDESLDVVVSRATMEDSSDSLPVSTMNSLSTATIAPLNKGQRLKGYDGHEGGQQLAGEIKKEGSLLKSTSELILTGKCIGDEGVIALAPMLPELQNLVDLGLARNEITATGMQRLAPYIGELEHLEILRIGGNRLGIMGMKELAVVLPKLKMLRKLYVSSIQMHEEGALALSECLQHLPLLERLDIGFNKISTAGQKAVRAAWLQTHPNLDGLWMEHNMAV